MSSNFFFRSRLNSGQSLYELVVAIAVSALIVTAVVSLAASSIQNSTFAKNKSVAGIYAQQASEWLRGQRNADMAGFVTKSSVTGSPTYWCLSDAILSNSSWNKQHTCFDSDVITGTKFLRELKFTTTTVSGKTQIEADVTVSWTDSKGIHLVTDATNFSDLRQR